MEALPPVGAGGPFRRAWHWGWTLALTATLLAGAAAVVLHSPWFKLGDIEVVGAEHADVAGRLAAAGVGRGAFMIWLRPGTIEAAVRGDPWVDDVRVERHFPDRLVVEVREQVPAVWVGSGDAWMLVSRTGTVVASAEAPGEGLLRARVPWGVFRPGEAPTGAEWRELAGLGLALSPELAAESQVTSEGGELWLEARGWRARLGRPEDLANKGRVFETLLASGLPAGATIDLVAPNRPAVTPPGAAEDGEAVVEGEDGG